MILTSIFNYFKLATPDEGLQAACFARAAEQYLDLRYSGNFSESQLSAYAACICVRVRRECI